ncbi:MAG: transcription-repair coupling factor [SAR324 cluster bacterium]|nr:transcription-repair coupling factor [SAR324 cluster bacterium]
MNHSGFDPSTKIAAGIAKIQAQRKGTIKLAGSPQSLSLLLLSSLVAQKSRPILLVAPTFETAFEAKADFGFFTSEAPNFFPHWDSLPYDHQSPSKQVVGQRMACLHRLLEGTGKITVTTSQALAQKILPKTELQSLSFSIKEGGNIDPQILAKKIAALGFTPVEMVEERGEFCKKGEIFDLFPIDAEEPVRIDFFDDEIESIKAFDIASQRSGAAVKEVLLLPATEVLLSQANCTLAASRLSDVRDKTEKNSFFQAREAIEERLGYSGIEALMPLFYEKTSNLLDYFTEPPIVVFLDEAAHKSQLEDHFNRAVEENRYAIEQGDVIAPVDQLFYQAGGVEQFLANSLKVDCDPSDQFQSGLHMQGAGNLHLAASGLEAGASLKPQAHRLLEQLVKWNKEGCKIAVAAVNGTRAEQIKQLVMELGATPTVNIDDAPEMRKGFLLTPASPINPSFMIFAHALTQGFRLLAEDHSSPIILVTEEEIFGTKQKKRRVKENNLKHFLGSLAEIQPGDYVVHVEYGIGQYEGLKKIAASAAEEDFLVIGYREEGKVYVPVEKFNLVQKYSGSEGGRPKMDKLGDKTWAKTKAKVQSEVDDIAEELIKLYAQREAQKGIAFSPDGSATHEFNLSFLFNETPDQLKAIEDVAADMESSRPMDRLVCGDVGFGKTEVALRASFKAVIDGYQVGVLAPTTILAQQHYETFIERYKGQAVKIGLLSRFVTAKEVKKNLEDLKNGKLDIIIGTHRLLSKDVVFKKLGLLVIDEEQRFGVKHKERIKQMRASVDCLTLSATPIPRTLHMSMIGVRDISVINTAPMDRRAVRTRLMKLNDYLITEAVTREMRRGGQTFFIHNRVESIHEVATYLRRLMPKIRIAVAHGQMAEKDLEQIMFDFIHKETDILLATTIVESGLDIPNANTIIINNSDQLGLSQLYQLRGRVGRSKEQAYCYLLTPKDKVLSETSKKRLSFLSELNHLGAGFKLASYDLELRGAGNILGSKQSGHITQIGFELYTQMINDAVALLNKTAPTTKLRDVKLSLSVEASLPEPFIPSMNQRLDAYKTISSSLSEDELWEIRAGIEDRYGPLPQKAVNLFDSMQVRLLASSIGLTRVDLKQKRLVLDFSEDFQPAPELLMQYLGSRKNVKLAPPTSIEAVMNNQTIEEVLGFLKEFQQFFQTDIMVAN